MEIRRGYVGQRTTDNGQRVGGSRWGYAKTTSQQDYETTSGAAAGGASQELWNYGTTDRASRLKAQSLSIPFYTLYTLYTQSSLLTVVMR